MESQSAITRGVFSRRLRSASMRRSNAASVGIVLLFSLLILPTHSFASKSPTPGAKCSKAKITQSFNGKLYTCKKSKGKLAWNKGVRINEEKAVASPAPLPLPTPTPSATASVPTAPTVTPSPSPSATSNQTLYTMDGVRANNSTSSCWTVIDGFVYDLTRWINAHPGGPSAIRSLCGVDGTASFKSQHQNQANPTQRLSGFLLGPLSK